MESNRLDRDAAAAQLAALQADRSALAHRVVPPWWYDVCLGLLLGGFVASYAFRSTWATVSATVVLVVGLNVLVSAYRRTTGVQVTMGAGTTVRAVVQWTAIMLVVLVPAIVLSEVSGEHWAMVVAGAVLAVAAVPFGRHARRGHTMGLRGAL